MASIDLCSVSQAKELIDMSSTVKADDPLLQRLITAASRAIRSDLRRDLAAAAYQETRDGTGTAVLVLKQYPVTNVTLLQVGSPPNARSTLVLNTDFVFTESAVKLLGGSGWGNGTSASRWAGSGVFPRGVATVYIAYQAGYVAIPEDLAGVCARQAALRFKEASRLGQNSKSLANETITFDTSAFTKYDQRILDLYRSALPLQP